MSQASTVPWTPVSLSQLPGFKCSTTADLQPATVYFKNNSTVNLEVYWIDYHGLHHRYHTLAPTKEVSQATSTGHPWVFKTTEGTAVAFFIVSATTDCRAVLTTEMLQNPEANHEPPKSFNGAASAHSDYAGNSGSSSHGAGTSDYSSNNYGQQQSRSSSAVSSSRGGSQHAYVDPRSPHVSRNASYPNDDRRPPQYDLRQPYPYHDAPAYDDRGGNYRDPSPPRGGGQAIRGEQQSYDKGPYGRDPHHSRSSSSHGIERGDPRGPPGGSAPYDLRQPHYDTRYDMRESHSQSHGGSNTTYYYPRGAVDPRGYHDPLPQSYDRRYDERAPPHDPYYDRPRDPYPPPRDPYQNDRNIQSYRPGGRQDPRDARDTRDLRDQWDDKNVDLRDQINLQRPKPRGDLRDTRDARDAPRDIRPSGDLRNRVDPPPDSRYPPGGSDNRDNRDRDRQTTQQGAPTTSTQRGPSSSSRSGRGQQDSSRDR